VILRGKDGAAAECHPPFPPMTAPRTWPASPTVLAGLIAEHAAADRTVGVLLVRLAGFAAGVFAGVPIVTLGTTPANSSPLNTTGYQLNVTSCIGRGNSSWSCPASPDGFSQR
jgi:hypothetical protein